MRAHGIHAPVACLSSQHRLTNRPYGFSAEGNDHLPHSVPTPQTRRPPAGRHPTNRPAARGHARRFVLGAVRHGATVRGARLTPSLTEFRPLGALIRRRGLVHRRALVGRTGPTRRTVGHNTGDQYLTRLRRKPRETHSHLTVATAAGIGHRLS
ncbi:DNA-binding response regulator [Streptomyces sp. NPDC093261]|uniref:DNA-binding response regulator n=1 Tax=Streptomyces sp. NPDC093261 TaxID=3366037 RepID=UPI003820AC2F